MTINKRAICHLIYYFGGILLMTILLSSCINRTIITQGNVIKEEEVGELRLGMSKAQVQFILGSPSIISLVDEDRWEYIYTIRNRFGRFRVQKGYIIFRDDRLAEISLDSYFNNN